MLARPMRRLHFTSAFLVTLFAASFAHADEPDAPPDTPPPLPTVPPDAQPTTPAAPTPKPKDAPPPPAPPPTSAANAEDAVPNDLARLVLDSGRASVPAAEVDVHRFFVQGEYQLRYQAMRSFTLDPSATTIQRRPGIIEDSLGQNQFVTHWLRVTPRLQLEDALEIVGQVDVLTGLLAGELAHDTHADRTPRDEYNGFSNIQLRWLYAQYKLPIGVIRVGQQPNHWGMGLLANDGDHPTLFGDYRYGSISERILFATKPAGKDSDFYLALAGDLVYRDNIARLSRGEQAFQGVLAAFYEKGFDKLGVFSTLRHQSTDKNSGSAIYTDEIDVLAVDVHGRMAVPVPGTDGFLFGEAEAATVVGSTNVLRTADQARDGGRTQVRSWGGAAVLGYVHRAYASGFWSDSAGDPVKARDAAMSYLGAPNARGVPYGDFVAQVEVGYASGDADPYDGTQKRFTFDPNHKVGLLLFDEVLRWQTARAATAAQDPLLTNATRPAPGIDLLPSNGGVFGAQYVNPTFIFRPRHWFDLKGGMVIAQSTADVVDPYRVATQGNYVNYRGGDPKRKDLGVELDAGFEMRLPLDYGMKLMLGAQGGVLFPGGALENADGSNLAAPWIVIGRAGVLF